MFPNKSLHAWSSHLGFMTAFPTHCSWCGWRLNPRLLLRLQVYKGSSCHRQEKIPVCRTPGSCVNLSAFSFSKLDSTSNLSTHFIGLFQLVWILPDFGLMLTCSPQDCVIGKCYHLISCSYFMVLTLNSLRTDSDLCPTISDLFWTWTPRFFHWHKVCS